MLYYLHDGTTDGIFSCVYDALKRRHKPDFIQDISSTDQDLLDEYIFIDTDLKKSEYIYELADRRISALAQNMIYIISLSHELNAGMIILNYLKEGLKKGKNAEYEYGCDAVLAAWNARNHVMCEYHKYLGFIRFSKIRGDIFLAEYAPENDLNLLLAEHFCDRMKNERWLICDNTRDKAVMYDGKRYIEVPFCSGDIRGLQSGSDDGFGILWKKFLGSVTIKERSNPKLQMSHMPKRYRKYMLENQ